MTSRATTRSSLLSTSHFAPPDAPAMVPICDGENPCRCTDARAPGPALKLSDSVIPSPTWRCSPP
jgi:hypothetical protein